MAAAGAAGAVVVLDATVVAVVTGTTVGRMAVTGDRGDRHLTVALVLAGFGRRAEARTSPAGRTDDVPEVEARGRRIDRLRVCVVVRSGATAATTEGTPTTTATGETAVGRVATDADRRARAMTSRTGRSIRSRRADRGSEGPGRPSRASSGRRCTTAAARAGAVGDRIGETTAVAVAEDVVLGLASVTTSRGRIPPDTAISSRADTRSGTRPATAAGHHDSVGETGTTLPDVRGTAATAGDRTVVRVGSPVAAPVPTSLTGVRRGEAVAPSSTRPSTSPLPPTSTCSDSPGVTEIVDVARAPSPPGPGKLKAVCPPSTHANQVVIDPPPPWAPSASTVTEHTPSGTT